MDNKPEDNIDIDKYTNYTYQSSEPQPASWDSYSAPGANTYSAPNVNTYSAPSGNTYSAPDVSAYSAPQAAQPQAPDRNTQPVSGGNFNPYAQADPYATPPQQPQTYQQTPYSAPVRYTQPGQYEQYVYVGGPDTHTEERPKASKGLSIAAMACGIASICTFSFIPGIVALCLSKKFRRANDGNHNSFSKTGKICGIIGIIISAIVIFVYIIIISALIFEAATEGGFYGNEIYF